VFINSVNVSNLAAGMKRQAWYFGLQNDGIENQISAFSKPDFFFEADAYFRTRRIFVNARNLDCGRAEKNSENELTQGHLLVW
jgi:hypothetical protein